MNLGTARIIRADSRNLPLPDNSVDLVITSPPYFALRSYQDGGEHYAGQIGDEPTPAEFVDSLLEVTRECMRVLKPSGSLWVNLGDSYARQGQDKAQSVAPDRQAPAPRQRLATNNGVRLKSLQGIPWRYAIRCIDDLGLILRAEVIWSKPNGLPESVTDRVRRSHEQWFHFTQQPRYFSAVDEIREAHAGEFLSTGARNPRHRYEDGKMPSHSAGILGSSSPQRRDGGTLVGEARNPLGKLPGSVWTVPTEPLRVPDHLGVDHFAAFPTRWPLQIIKAWCPEGLWTCKCGQKELLGTRACACCGRDRNGAPTSQGVVLDPFGGTGTTAMVAKALGRDAVSVDMSEDYCRLARWRTNDRDQLAKVLGIEKAEPVHPDEIPMFDLEGGAA